MAYNRETILSEEDVKYLLDELLPSLKEERIRRYYNLFYCKKIDVDQPSGLPQDPRWKAINDKLLEHSDSDRVYSHYFMKYAHPAFVRRHTDNVDEVTKTLVTLLQEAEEGGENILYSTHHKEDYEWEDETDTNRYTKDDDALHSPIIPIVPKHNVGETLIYDRDTYHEVAQVQKGERIVLISWFSNYEQRESD